MSMADILSDCTFALSVFPVSLQECSPMMTTQSCSGSTPPLWRMKRSTHSLESSWDLPFITTASWTFIFLWLSTGSWWERKGRSWTYQTHIQYSSYNLARFKAQVDFCFCFLRYLLTFFPQNQIFSCDRVTETLCLCCRFYTKAWKSCWSTRAMWKKTWCSLFRYRTQIYLEIQYCMIWRSREIRLLLPRQTDRSDIYVCRPQSEWSLWANIVCHSTGKYFCTFSILEFSQKKLDVQVEDTNNAFIFKSLHLLSRVKHLKAKNI